MSPDLPYVADAMRHGDVEISLKNWKNPFKRRVYMVTGVRIVSGAHLKRREAASSKHTGVAEGAAPDQSLSAGTQGDVATSSTESEEFEKASDFVFAYRLNEVEYRGTVAHRPYTGGEAASAEKHPEQRGDEVVIDDFEVLELSEVDLADEEDDFERVQVPGYEEIETFLGKGDGGDEEDDE
jgi:hypothetical protein